MKFLGSINNDLYRLNDSVDVRLISDCDVSSRNWRSNQA